MKWEVSGNIDLVMTRRVAVNAASPAFAVLNASKVVFNRFCTNFIVTVDSMRELGWAVGDPDGSLDG